MNLAGAKDRFPKGITFFTDGVVAAAAAAADDGKPALVAGWASI